MVSDTESGNHRQMPMQGTDKNTTRGFFAVGRTVSAPTSRSAAKAVCRTAMLVIPAAIFLLSPSPSAAAPNTHDRLVLMWQVQKDVTDADLLFLKRKGVNLVQSFPLILWQDTDIRSYLDRMDRHDIGVIISLVSLTRKIDGKWIADRQAFADVIAKWKNHPAIFAWHTFDEPSNRNSHEIPVSIQEEVYRLVKSLDPVHPVMVSWNGTAPRHYRYFSEKAFDILDLHAYIRDTIGTRQKSLVASFGQHRAGRYPVIITIGLLYRRGAQPLPWKAAKEQHDFFFRENRITKNIGFYGWDLSKNIGIKQDPELREQFLKLDLSQ